MPGAPRPFPYSEASIPRPASLRPEAPRPPSLRPEPPPLPPEADGDDHDIAWNAGLLINPNGKVSFGLVYKDGGSYEVDTAVGTVLVDLL